MKSITIVGTRWFSKTSGSFYSTYVYLGKELIGSKHEDQGYGEEYLEAGKKLINASSLPSFEHYEYRSEYEKRTGYEILTLVSDVERKKHL